MKAALLSWLAFVLYVSARASDAPSVVTPQRTNDGWETEAPSDVKMNAGLIGDLLGRIRDNTYKNIHGVLLVKDGKLIVEEYFPGQQQNGQQQTFTRDTLHEMARRLTETTRVTLRLF